MKKPFKYILERGEFTVYSREVDQKTLEERVTLARNGKPVAAIIKRGNVVVEVDVDAMDKELGH